MLAVTTVMLKGGQNSIQSINPFPTVFSKGFSLGFVKIQYFVGKKLMLCLHFKVSAINLSVLFQATCLSSHQKHNHSNEIRFKCTDCDFVSIMRIEILRHYRNIHLQQKIYACNQCEYRTGYTYLLKFHLMSHAGIKPFKCSLCDYQVCNSTKVTRHIKTVHVGQKEAKCIKLDLTFEIDAKQFKCAEPVSEKDIKVIELTEEEIKVYGEKRRKQAQLKKEEKERKKTARMPNKVVKTKSVKMVSLLGNIMDVRKEQDDADIIGQPLAH